METRDKLIIKEGKRLYSNNINEYNAFLHGVEFAEDLLKPKWNRSTDILPTEEEYYFCACVGDYRFLLFLRDKWYDPTTNSFEALDRVTHWLPIPKLNPYD